MNRIKMFFQKQRLFKPGERGLSFIEVMVSLTILTALFVFCLPFFVTAQYSNTKEGMVVAATQTSQGIIDSLKRSAHSYDSANSCYIYDRLQIMYTTATSSTVNPALLAGTPFKQDQSYIVVYDETGSSSSAPDNVAKRIVVHLVWDEKTANGTQTKSFTNASYVGRPSIAFSRQPGCAIPPAGLLSTTSSTTSTTSSTTTSSTTSSTTSTSTSSIPTTSTTSTTSIPTTSTTSTSTSSVPTTSTTSTSTSSIPTTSTTTSTSSTIPTTSTTSTSTSSTTSTSTSSTTTTSIDPNL